MNIEVSRRHFMKAGWGWCCGYGHWGRLASARRSKRSPRTIRPFKLANADRDPQHLPVLLGRLRHHHVQPGRSEEGRKGRDHPHRGRPRSPDQRGTLCPKGAALLDFVKSETRTKYPMVREPGANEWKRMSWDDALDRIAG